jgi:predicted GNAT family acetyltransferase
MSVLLIDNTAESRFERRENGVLSFADYRRGPDRIILTHVETEPRGQGSGMAGRLMAAIVAEASERRLKIEPRCPYAAAWFDRNPQHQSLRVEPQIPQDGTDGLAFLPPDV